MSSDMDELFWEKNQLAKGCQFQKELSGIEERHQSFFSERQAKFADQVHDRLYNHYFTRSTNNGYEEFSFLPGSDLPEPIRKECLAAFDSVYKS